MYLVSWRGNEVDLTTPKSEKQIQQIMKQNETRTKASV